MNFLGDGYRHTIVSMNGNADCHVRIDRSVPVELITVAASPHNFLGNVAGFRRRLRLLKPDLVLTFNFGALEWALAESLQPEPTNIHFESGFSAEEAQRQLRRRVFFRRLALWRTRDIVVPSRTLYKVARDVWRISDDRLRHIKEGVDLAQYAVPQTVDCGQGAPVVGTVAPLRPVKNLAALVQAFARLRERSDARLLIVGGGPELPRLRQLSQELGIAARTELTGHVDDVAAQLARMDIFVLSSYSEQMPTAVLQAMAAGRAIVAHDVGDVRLMLPRENQRYLVDPSDNKALADRISLLLQYPDVRRAAAQANLRAARGFGEREMLEEYRNLFDRALKRGPPAHLRQKAAVHAHPKHPAKHASHRSG